MWPEIFKNVYFCTPKKRVLSFVSLRLLYVYTLPDSSSCRQKKNTPARHKHQFTPLQRETQKPTGYVTIHFQDENAPGRNAEESSIKTT